MSRTPNYGSTGPSGRYRKVPIDELREIFGELVAEGKLRSLKAVLRITREQFDARGRFGTMRAPMLVMFVLTAGMAAFAKWGPLSAHDKANEFTIVLGLATLVFGIALFSVRHDLRRANRESPKLAALCLESVRAILASGNVPQPELDPEHREALRESLKTLKDRDPTLWELAKGR